MPPTKKDAVTKSANRPCRGIAPPDAAAVAPVSSSRFIMNGARGKVTKTRPSKGRTSVYLNMDEDDASDDYKPFGLRSKSIDSDEFEIDQDMAEGSDEEFTIGKKAKSKAARNTKQKAKADTKAKTKTVVNAGGKAKCMSKKDGAAPDPHGRVKGRDLIPWTRPRMFEKLLLHLQYEAELADIKLPWNAAVHRLHIGSNEGAATQQLAKLREILITEGHMVPPRAKVKNKQGVEFHPQMRGYIRPEGSANPYESRIVGWDEKIVDRSKNLENPGIYRGSGRYPRVGKSGQAVGANGASRPPKKPRATRSSALKPKLMVTLKLSPKHLRKFLSESGNDQTVNSPQPTNDGEDDKSATVKDESEFDEEVESDTEDQGEYESAEEESDSEVDSDNETGEDSPAKLIKQESADEEMHDVANKVNGNMIGHTINSLNNGIGSAMHVTTPSNDTYGGLMVANFNTMGGGNLANTNQFGGLTAFRTSAAAFGGHNLVYSPGTLDPCNLYNGPSILASNSYVSPAALTMGMGTGYGMGVVTPPNPAHSYYQGPSMGQAPAAGIFQSSGGSNMKTGDGRQGGMGGSPNIKVTESLIHGHETEEKSYASNPSRVYSSDIFGFGSPGDNDDDIFDSFLQHDQEDFDLSD